MRRIICYAVVSCLSLLFTADRGLSADRPNIVWITCEDISPNLGCYGDAYAVTPHIDRLATQGVRYTLAFAPIGVCAPSRSCLITGMYACSIGSQHMRCKANLPDFVRCFPHYLREAGYYCTNNVKTDYNFDAPRGSWDESSNKAHWRNRREGQPFFSVFNFTTSHESQIRIAENQYKQRTADFTHAERHDPARAPIPPYHPDTPETRRDWARYADMITFMDKQVAGVLSELEQDELSDDTIVFYFSDHGAGMPRSKRWLYESSTRVPLIIRCPEKFRKLVPGKPGTTCDDLVNFVDFGPTVLSLAGVEIPSHLQGTPFLGQRGAPREYIHGYRDRMDERYDMLRMTRDRRYRYIRNYMPHLPYFQHQHISYMYEMPTMRIWQSLADQGKLTGPPAALMAMSKPIEELYDTEADPWEVNNLANSREHRETLVRLRNECRRWQEEILDLGFWPEAELRTRFGEEPPYVAVRRDPNRYPWKRIAAAADVATQRSAENVAQLIDMFSDHDPAIRYWAATGLGSLEKAPSDEAIHALETGLTDSAGAVRVAAADALCRFGKYDKSVEALGKCLTDQNEWVRLQAMNVLDRIDEHARPLWSAIREAGKDKNEYVNRVAQHTLSIAP